MIHLQNRHSAQAAFFNQAPVHQAQAMPAAYPANPPRAAWPFVQFPQTGACAFGPAAPGVFGAPCADTSRHGGFRGAAPGHSPLRHVPRNVDYSGLVIGPKIGSGAFKRAHQIISPATGMPTGEVLVIEKSRKTHAIAKEIGQLTVLNEMGLPVAPIRSTGHYRGHSAMQLPDMLGTFHPFMVRFPGWLDQMVASPHVTRETVRSLQQILAQIDMQGIHLRDMQVLMDGRDGSLYITDPLGFRPGTTQDHLWGRCMPNLLGTRKPLQTMLERLYERFPDMRPARPTRPW